MLLYDNLLQLILGIILIFSAICVILVRQPVHACLSFLTTLLTLAVYYLQLSAPFIAATQILVYAGAILVIFMFVVILFQDAHQQIDRLSSKINKIGVALAAAAFGITFLCLGYKFLALESFPSELTPEFSQVESLGQTIYLDFFFPFEAMVLLFLVALVGAVYIGKREKVK